jgi:hypothetical protein
MPEPVYLVLMQYFAETTSPRFTHIRRARLPDEAYDYLAVRIAAASLQRAAILQVAMRMIMVYQQREAAYQDMLGTRWYRQQDRAMQAIPSLLPHDTVTVRVRQLVRAHQIATETLTALLQQHPRLRAAAARIRQRAEVNFLEDESSSAGSDTDYEP